MFRQQFAHCVPRPVIASWRVIGWKLPLDYSGLGAELPDGDQQYENSKDDNQEFR